VNRQMTFRIGKDIEMHQQVLTRGSKGSHKGLRFILRTMECVQGLLSLSLCRQANDSQDWERHMCF